MKTAYYTFTTWDGDAKAAGFDGSLSQGRRAALMGQSEETRCIREEGKVIDLTAWRAANLDLPEEEPLNDWGQAGEDAAELKEPELSIPAPRPRKSRRAMLTAELVSTLSVAAAALVLILRVLIF